MCLYPKLIRNRKYTPNQKNNGIAPQMPDPRVQWVPIGCQNCIECRNQKARAWNLRLQEEVRHNTNGKFITLTFSTESLQELKQDIPPYITGYALDNAIATLAVRRFLERWRSKYKVSLRHWLITELGHGTTEHLHLHGIIWVDNHIITYKTKPGRSKLWNKTVLNGIDEIEKTWQYGFVWKGHKLPNGKYENYVNANTASYITKYVTKIDQLHKEYTPKILCSPGIGRQYTTTLNSRLNKYQGTKTNELYRTTTGHKMSLPIYWRNKIYTEQEREQLWLNRLDKEERWIRGEKVSTKNGMDSFYRLLEWHRARNEELGYGKNKEWQKQDYENKRRQLIHKARLQRLPSSGE